MTPPTDPTPDEARLRELLPDRLEDEMENETVLPGCEHPVMVCTACIKPSLLDALAELRSRAESAEAEAGRLRAELESDGTHEAVARAACEDCGAPYGEDGWCDVVIPNEVWNALPGSPGLLCFRCMTKRLQAAGYSERNPVPVIVASGPYRDANEEWRLIGIEHGEKLARDELESAEDEAGRLRRVVENVARYTGNGPPGSPWRDIVRDLSIEARAALRGEVSGG